MTRVEGAWLSKPQSQRLLTLFLKEGFKAFFVGGCVRNALLDAPVQDLDVATDALPTEILALAKRNSIKAVPTGLDHGTVTLILENEVFEVTTFRKDVATDGRRAVVVYSKDVKEDAQRRDFTMNALYADRFGQVTDPVGGLPDLAARRIRFIEDPDQRIKEDYLRILRFFRFQAWYGDPVQGFDPEALDGCAQNAQGLGRLSKERIGAEMRKLLAAPDPAFALAGLFRTGCLSQILPGADPEYIGPLSHFTSQSHPMLRLAALGGNDPVGNLRLSREDASKLKALKDHIGSAQPDHELAYRLGAEKAEAVLALRAAMLGPVVIDRERLTVASQQSFPISASDLDRVFSGKALGDRLKELETAWIKSEFALTKQELLQLPG